LGEILIIEALEVDKGNGHGEGLGYERARKIRAKTARRGVKAEVGVSTGGATNSFFYDRVHVVSGVANPVGSRSGSDEYLLCPGRGEVKDRESVDGCILCRGFYKDIYIPRVFTYL
jgi:hypothetical protein